MLKQKIIITITTLLLFMPLANFSFAEDDLSLFETVEFKSSNFNSVPKWVKILDKMILENKDIEACEKNLTRCNNEFLKQWLFFLEQSKEIKNKEILLNSVNAFFNEWEYILDIDNWNLSDYWEIPSEFLEFSGDCEDYVIIKYYTLKKLGFKTNDLRIVIVKDIVRNGAHAVLAVYQNNQIYILDNLSTIALNDDLLTQYKPYYSINEKFKWIHFKKL